MDEEKKKRTGANLEPVFCPECLTKMPRIRIPRSYTEFMHGGWTCHKCGVEMDRWGELRLPEVKEEPPPAPF